MRVEVIVKVEVGKGDNRSPKGNRWSAMPIALLSMFVTVGND